MSFRCRTPARILLLAGMTGLLLFPSIAGGQDLAAAARKEKERRARAKAETTKVYGTDDLAAGRPASPSPATDGNTSAGVGAPPGGQAAAPAVSDDSQARARQEAYWRERARVARANLAEAERRFADLDALAARTMIAPPDGVVIRRESWAKRREDLLHALEQAKSALAAARQALAGLEDEARRAGALPGWLR